MKQSNHLFCDCVLCRSEVLGFNRGFLWSNGWRQYYHNHRHEFTKSELREIKHRHSEYLDKRLYITEHEIDGEPVECNFDGVPCGVWQRYVFERPGLLQHPGRGSIRPRQIVKALTDTALVCGEEDRGKNP